MGSQGEKNKGEKPTPNPPFPTEISKTKNYSNYVTLNITKMLTKCKENIIKPSNPISVNTHEKCWKMATFGVLYYIY